MRSLLLGCDLGADSGLIRTRVPSSAVCSVARYVVASLLVNGRARSALPSATEAGLRIRFPQEESAASRPFQCALPIASSWDSSLCAVFSDAAGFPAPAISDAAALCIDWAKQRAEALVLAQVFGKLVTCPPHGCLRVSYRSVGKKCLLLASQGM